MRTRKHVLDESFVPGNIDKTEAQITEEAGRVCQLLLDIYLAMTGGQGALTLETGAATPHAALTVGRAERPSWPLLVRRATQAELDAHERMLDVLDRASGGRTVWRVLESVS